MTFTVHLVRQKRREILMWFNGGLELWASMRRLEGRGIFTASQFPPPPVLSFYGPITWAVSTFQIMLLPGRRVY